MKPVGVTLVTRVGCHLCERAEQVLRQVLSETPTPPGMPDLTVLDVDGELGKHSDHRAEWSELVPVVLIEDRVHAVIRVDPARLRAALAISTVRESIHKR